jgi:hypothetical protein
MVDDRTDGTRRTRARAYRSKLRSLPEDRTWCDISTIIVMGYKVGYKSGCEFARAHFAGARSGMHALSALDADRNPLELRSTYIVRLHNFITSSDPSEQSFIPSHILRMFTE